MNHTLNQQQQNIIEKLHQFASTTNNEPFFVIKGSAGTGKTFLLKRFIEGFKGRIVFTAPTNKATRVLRDVLHTDDYKPECRTIYSLLGLTLETNGEVKELKVPEDPLDLSKFQLVFVDEGSMLNSAILKHIIETCKEFKLKFVFLGDPAQLPPVGEKVSQIWNIKNVGELTKVVRHDNQILELAIRLRQALEHPAPNAKLESNNDGEEGVWVVSAAELRKQVRSAAEAGLLSGKPVAKVIAWRNKTVDEFNGIVRQALFGNGAPQWVPEDRLILAGPAKDRSDEPIASTDDEGLVTKVWEDFHPDYSEFKTWELQVVLDSNKIVRLSALHPDSKLAYDSRCNELSFEAKMDKKKWRHFWQFKEAFHMVKHGYAITAHRSQGSTYDKVFVDYRDILCNQVRHEAFQCLYVACTRPRKVLVLG
jgi:exodeoxyribonuclease-5